VATRKADFEEADRCRPHRQDLVRPRDALVEQAILRNHGVDEAHLERLFGIVAAAQETRSLGLLVATSRARSPMRSRRRNCDLGADLAEDGAIRRDREVADDVEHVPAADREAVHQGR